MLPDAFAIASSDNCYVEDISIATVQARDSFHGDGEIKINGFNFKLTFDELSATVDLDTYASVSSPRTLQTEILAIMLLNIVAGNNRLEAEDITEIIHRSPTTPDLMYQILGKMALFTGSTIHITRAVFDNSPTCAYMVDLIDGETPHANATVLNIDLSHDLRNRIEELDSTQGITMTGYDTMTIHDQRVTIIPENALPPENFILAKQLGHQNNQTPYLLTPHGHFDEWAMVCRTFNKYIEPHIAPYRRRNEAIEAELIDTQDFDTFSSIYD